MKKKPTPLALKICLAQINTTVGDIEGNVEKINASLDFARGRGAELVVFPELALTGYPPEDLLFHKNFVSANLAALKSLRPRTGQLMAVVGFADRDTQGRLFNAAAVIADKKIIGVYHKTRLPNYGVFDERRYFSAGNKPLIVQRRGLRIGVSICEDIWQKSSFLYQKNFRGCVSLLVNISASPYHAGKQRERVMLLKRLASSLGAPVIYQNLVGGQDELVFDGGSLVVSRSGQILAEARRFQEDHLVVELSKRGVSKNKKLSYEAEVYEALVLGTRDYICKNRFKKALIGLSGGIDSALVAGIAVDALGPGNVIGATMPSRVTSQETLRDARRLAKNLRIRCLEFPINGILQKYLKTLQHSLGEPVAGITEENLQARIRGSLLMALSNKYGYLVLTTGNKSEMATGYCTLYGDMAGGFAVIKDVPKTLVFKLARYRNRRAPQGPIPASILKRAPSAELRFHQKDQDTLPPYEALDRFLEYYVEKDMPADEIVHRGISKKTVYEMKRRVDGNEYKRRQAPPGVKITLKAFGRDRRMPITNRFTG